MTFRRKEYLESLIKELISLPTETEWLEFKVNNIDPIKIGTYISSISNSAALLNRTRGYLIWGIDDSSHQIIGTTFRYRNEKKGSEQLESWLARMTSPRIDFRFYDLEIEGKHLTILEIPRADKEPIKFAGETYIRVGASTKNIKEYPSKESALWKVFDKTPFELKVSKENVLKEEVLNLLNAQIYYEKTGFKLPENTNKIIEDFISEKFVIKNDAGKYDITNLGAISLANDLNNFNGLFRKSVRVIEYKGNNKLETKKEKVFSEGYAISYDKLFEYVWNSLPQEETIEKGIRKIKFSYPEIAIRELIANLLIHQSLEQKGTNPMIEIFQYRIEFANAGAPLVSVDRILDSIPISRNENLTSFLRKCGICEERGSGYDKIIDATSNNYMIAPKIENQNNQFTKVTLFSNELIEIISKEDKIRTCYMKTCLNYVNGESVSNTTIRELFGFSEKDKYKASRIIKDTLEAGLIKPVDKNTAPRYMKYIPFWG